MLGTIEFIDKSVNDNSACRLDHCQVIASHSEARCAPQKSWTPNWFKVINSSSFGIKKQHKGWTVGGSYIKSSRSVYAPHLVQSMRLLLFKYRGADNMHCISENKMAATALQWELCGTNLCENIVNLRVSCHDGNNDRSALVLFIRADRSVSF